MVWTDVMQGIIMFVGVIVMLVLVLHQTGGLESATRTLAKMTPPVEGKAAIELPGGADDLFLPQGTWLKTTGESAIATDDWAARRPMATTVPVFESLMPRRTDTGGLLSSLRS